MNLKGVGKWIAGGLGKLRGFVSRPSNFSCKADNEATRALEAARDLAKKGDYEGSLEKHVWFHENALRIQPSYYGVRLSFALADWIKLGEKYPKALEKLKSIRDQKTSSLLAGETNRHLFHDVRSINDYLDEAASTVELFKRIEATNSDFAADVYNLADRALLQTHEYALARKYLGDPKERLATAQKYFREGIKFAETSILPEPARRSTEQIFAEDAALVVTILRETGDKEAAAKIQRAALETLDDEKIRNALKE